MNKIMIVFLVLIIVISGCVSQRETKNASGTTTSSPLTPTFEYEKDGKTYTTNLFDDLRPATEWIKDNLPKNSVVVAWWDYGHMIRGFGKAEAIVFTPSKEILDTVALTPIDKFDTEKSGQLSNHEDIKNVAFILTTTNPQEAITVMRQYNSKYVLVTSSEYGKAYVLYEMTGVPTEIVDGFALNKNSILYKMLKSEPINGFEIGYSDSFAVVYKIKS